MRIVLIHRYFWPDTPPYAHILKDIALRFGEAGHEVTVLTCQPSYNRAVVQRAARVEQLAPRVEVRRWAVLPDRQSSLLKAVNLAVFCLRLLRAGRRLGSVDVVMAASAPPIAVAKVASWMARFRGARFVYHKQDIYPEVVIAPGILRARRLAAVLRWVDTRTERSAARVVVLSGDMAGTVIARGTDTQKVVIINNFDPWVADQHEGNESRLTGAVPHNHNGRPLRVVFAGNLGRFQNLEAVIAAAVQLRDEPRVVFHFFGDGALRPELERTVVSQHLQNVQVHGYVSPEEVAEFLRAQADLGIVSLARGVIKAAYPSKTMSYLRQGCPVLALVEPDSELVRTLTTAGAGIHADASDRDGIAGALRDLADQPWKLVAAGARARELYETQFSPDRQLALWLGLLEDLQPRRAA